MKIGLLKFLDKYLGFFICLILSVITKFFGADNKTINNDTTQKTLFMKFWGLGSILLLSPTIKEFKNTFPNAKITFLTLARNREISESLMLFDEVLTIDVDNGWLKYFKDLVGNILHFWKERYDLVIDFEFFTRFSAIITFLTFARNKIGYHSWETWRGNIHNIKVPFNRYWHITENFYNLVRCIGIKRLNELTIIKPFVSEQDKTFILGMLRDSKVKRDFISVHVNAGELSIERRWPYENFILLINRLLLEYDLDVIFIGSKSERSFVREIIEKIKSNSIADFVGRLSITQLAHLFEKSRLIISNDSGPLHLAVAMGTPTVSFFGPETPVIYGPIGKSHTVFFKNIDCSPCMNVHNRKSVHCYWKKPKCMEQISVDEVFCEVAGKINEKGICKRK